MSSFPQYLIALSSIDLFLFFLILFTLLNFLFYIPINSFNDIFKALDIFITIFNLGLFSFPVAISEIVPTDTPVILVYISLKSGREISIDKFKCITYLNKHNINTITKVENFDNFYLYSKEFLTFVGESDILTLNAKDIEFVKFINVSSN